MKARRLSSWTGYVNAPAMDRFLDAVLHEFLEALDLLKWTAAEITPQTSICRPCQPMTTVRPPKGTKATQTCRELLGAYVAATKPTQSTATAWGGRISAPERHLDGRSIDDFTNSRADTTSPSKGG
jgi:hypothetical protein